MLKELKFVSGAVAKKDLVPYMSHFAIENQTVKSYNGMIALCSPIQFDIDCKPKADLLIKAIGNCSETIALSMTGAGRLKVSSGKFKAFIDCLVEETPTIEPEGEIVEINGELLIAALTKLYKFIGDDASRPWATGVLLKGSSGYATNNICIIEHWLGFKVNHTINIPKAAIREILRIDGVPQHVQIAERSITFHYEENKWIKSQLLDTDWPDMARILNKDTNPIKLEQEIFKGLEVLKPFVDNLGSIFFKENVMAVSHDLTVGATFEIDEMFVEGRYNIEMLGLLKGVAEEIDWDLTPALFFGDKLRGAIVGMRE